MITYILQVILGSGLFLLAYKLLLEKASFHQFKRFYLLAAIVFSFILPMIPKSAESIPANTLLVMSMESAQPAGDSVPYQESPIDYSWLPWLFIGIVSLILLCRFVRQLVLLLKKVRDGSKSIYNKAQLVRLKGDILPHSFMHYLFVSDHGLPSEEILRHELAHIRQRHSLDVVFMELVLIIAWLNPFFWFFRQAIRLNHEFLADQSVLECHPAPTDYQYLLIRQSAGVKPGMLTSTFTYANIKKRLIMMQVQTPAPLKAARILALIPVLVIVVMFTGRTTFAQVNSDQEMTERPQNQTAGVSEAELREYKDIALSNRDKQGFFNLELFSETEIERMKDIFLRMNSNQRSEQLVRFMPVPMPLKEMRPTEKMYEQFKNPQEYGVWIDNKHVENSELDNYSAGDFAVAYVSKLMPNAKNYGKHVYQLELITNERHAHQWELASEREGEYTIVVPYRKAE